MNPTVAPRFSLELGALCAAMFSLAVPALVWFSSEPGLSVHWSASKSSLHVPFVGEVGFQVNYRLAYVYSTLVASALAAVSGCYAILASLHPFTRRRSPVLAAVAVIVASMGLLWAVGLYWPMLFPSGA